ncbi:hypothetical protein KUTeg_021042 [Tegillarca granosa]|uniref:Kinesin-like protein n=1 Tax=Tegillarca granosa TaxID=220873 RepID=A0ABQ9EF37_TEGGR|nr:hypothetical protein KUTeg_021042 [Tegillarca granosa]
MGNGASSDTGSTTTVNVKPATTTQNNSGATTPRRRDFQEVEIRQSPSHRREQVTQRRGAARSDAIHRNEQANGGASGATPRQQQPQQRQSQGSKPKSQDDIVFETFYHRSGREFQCMYLGGIRYYLDDWGSKEWQVFPKRWYNEGLLITNTVVKDDQAVAEHNRRRDASGAAGASTSRSRGQGQGQDDREGVIIHPSKGKINTYIFQRKHNIHCFADPISGQWMRMPIGYELHHELVARLVDQVEEALPNWKDRHDILAMLRQCNYDADECISTYLHLEGDVWLTAPKTSKDAKTLKEKDDKIADLQNMLKHLNEEYKKEKQARQDAEKMVADLEDKLTKLEVDNKQVEAQMMALAGNRPKTARPKTPQVVTQVVKEQTVNPEDIEILNENAKELRTAQVHLRHEMQRYLAQYKDMLGKAVDGMKKLKASGAGQSEELEEVRALYRKEAMQRKLLYNQLQEMRGNIRVFCRVRKDDRAENCLKFPTDQDIVAIHPQTGKKLFSFDKVFAMDATQEQIFDDTKPIITSCVDGYNVSLLAYGQTGSGKTFTMMGPENNPGINVRAIKELFTVTQERTETMSYEISVSMIEIYNETIADLLNNEAKVLELRTAGNKVSIPGLSEVPIRSMDDIKKVMKMGEQNRSVASTKMNSTSSRSHLLVMINVMGEDKVTGNSSRGVLTLCDLAGSERISKTEAEGQRLVEAAAINKSLSALGQSDEIVVIVIYGVKTNVFTALRTSQLHIPYRNSKLTQILQPSLGGDAKACLFVNCSPDLNNFQETVSTLSFGANARQVALGQAKQNVKKGPGKG